ncbi:septum formation family protein [Streptomyces somaliensis DSM 40738]|uniref:septum formation family protein n=1 Tax=Streptomyces somaliensis TaxID=78355 RepID=UPI0021C39F72|nr:septum formation family protein [Streptomyces somaliensis]MCQ0025602.1 septum formation family protein [Streptomyces somaliensis DSM 40738]
MGRSLIFRLAAAAAVVSVAGCATTRSGGPDEAANPSSRQTAPTKGLPTGKPVPFPSLTVGMCSNDDGAFTAAEPVGVVDCAAPHRFEILAKVRVPGGPDAPFPGRSTLVEQLTKACDPTLEPLVTAARGARIGMQLLPFDEKSWTDGNRTGYCAVTFPEPTTGTVRG